MERPYRVAILTASDRCSRGETVDTSGPALAALVEAELEAAVVARACLPDDARLLAAKLRRWVRMAGAPDLVLTTGGTGFSPRDVTPEATRSVLEREAPGLMELARSACGKKSPRAYLSRGIAGIARRTLIINLPGSQRGATESLAAVLQLLPHALDVLRGDVKDDGRPRPTSTSPRSTWPLTTPSVSPPPRR